MSPYRCQLCSRRKGVRKNGTIVAHYVRGERCPGAGYPPIEESDARLIEYTRETEIKLRFVRGTIRALEERRANWIDPSLLAQRFKLIDRLDKLRRRIDRHHGWPSRIARQLERHGYTIDRHPPAYLVARMATA